MRIAAVGVAFWSIRTIIVSERPPFTIWITSSIRDSGGAGAGVGGETMAFTGPGLTAVACPSISEATLRVAVRSRVVVCIFCLFLKASAAGGRQTAQLFGVGLHVVP